METLADVARKLEEKGVLRRLGAADKDSHSRRGAEDRDDHDGFSTMSKQKTPNRKRTTRKSFSTTQPLYQWITTEEIMKQTTGLSRESGADSQSEKDESPIEAVERVLERSCSNVGRQLQSEESVIERRRVIRDVFSKGGFLVRTAWSEMREVIDSGVLESLTAEEIKLQEAMFEILTSEASYLRSLLVLESVFLKAPEFTFLDDRCLISRKDYTTLFCNITDITKSSSEFLDELEDEWEKSCVLDDICDIISEHAQNAFRLYIRYCSNQVFQDRTLQQLQEQPRFVEAVRRLQRSPACQSLSLGSFLLLPMQRITRLPLLVTAILKRLDPGTPRHASASQALDRLKGLVRECDEGARKMQNAEEMLQLRNCFHFKTTKEFPLVSASRSFVKKGRMIMLQATKRPLSWLRGPKTTVLDVFLFTDVLVLTRKDGDMYNVENWCLRDKVDVHDATNMSWLTDVPGYLFSLCLGSNHEGKKEEFLVSVESESEFTRWMEALSPKGCDSSAEKSARSQAESLLVECIKRHIAHETDEISLELAEIVTVLRKTDDGWYWGERIRDGQRGWFPAQNIEVIANQQVLQYYMQMRDSLSSAEPQHPNLQTTEIVKMRGSSFEEPDESSC